MKRNMVLEIEYLGTNYYGFQIQATKSGQKITVQAVIEKALFKLFKEKIRIVYAGRTDRGVHAKAQIVNFKVDTKIAFPNIKTAVNNFLPSDVKIIKIKKVPLDFHARFWAKSKIYRYMIFNGPEESVFGNNRFWQITFALDHEKMQKAAKKLVGVKDFSLFAKDAKQYKSCRRQIKNISIEKKAKTICIDIEASGFLRNMARNIVSFLVDIGQGKIALSSVSKILQGKLVYIKKPAPAFGLYLLKVKYK